MPVDVLSSEDKARLEKLFFQLQEAKFQAQKLNYQIQIQANELSSLRIDFTRIKLSQEKAFNFISYVLEKASNDVEVPAPVPPNLVSDYKLVKASQIFDPVYYLKNNDDVAASGLDPLLHYLQYGYKEGRRPSLQFNSNCYLEKYLDVSALGLNPLVHYIRYGLVEGRTDD